MTFAPRLPREIAAHNLGLTEGHIEMLTFALMLVQGATDENRINDAISQLTAKLDEAVARRRTFRE